MFEVNLNDLLRSFCSILDMASNRKFEHSRRTAYVALRLARKLDLPYSKQRDIYYASLLHDIGMAGELAKYSIISFHFKSSLVKLHVDLGYDIVKHLPLGNNKIAEFIKFHHEHWDGTGPYGLKENSIPLESQIIYIADRFDLATENSSSWVDIEKIKDKFKGLKGNIFNSYLIDIFLQLLDTLDFWLDLKQGELNEVLRYIEPKKSISVDFSGLKNIAQAFAIVLDSKSQFTRKHSQGVAEFSNLLARKMGKGEEEVNQITIAGFFHDLGKFAVPTEILDKPGKLTPEEFKIIKTHPYYTTHILMQVSGLQKIARWAGNHHENLKGTGYPRKLKSFELDDADRIIAIADQFQALTEERPYRKGSNYSDALKIMESNAKRNFIDKKILGLLKRYI